MRRLKPLPHRPRRMSEGELYLARREYERRAAAGKDTSVIHRKLVLDKVLLLRRRGAGHA
jgi:hypothetical protein